MTSATGCARTLHAAKYIQQLCKHWAHKLEVEQSGQTGVVHFPAGVATMTAGTGELTVTISAQDEATVERLKGVVATRLDRFAFREAPLSFEWSAE